MKLLFPKIRCKQCDKSWIPRSKTPPETPCSDCNGELEIVYPDELGSYGLPEIECSCGHKWTPRREELPDMCRECMKTDYTIHQPTGKSYKVKPGRLEEVTNA